MPPKTSRTQIPAPLPSVDAPDAPADCFLEFVAPVTLNDDPYGSGRIRVVTFDPSYAGSPGVNVFVTMTAKEGKPIAAYLAELRRIAGDAPPVDVSVYCAALGIVLVVRALGIELVDASKGAIVFHAWGETCTTRKPEPAPPGFEVSAGSRIDARARRGKVGRSRGTSSAPVN